MATEAVEERDRLKATLARWRAQGAEQFGYIKQTAEVGAAALGIGFLKGRYGDPATGKYEIFGVDVDLGGAFLLKGVAFAGLGGRYDEDLHNLGDGLFAVWAASKGIELGMESAEGGSTAGTGRMAAARRGQQRSFGAGRPGDDLQARIARMQAR